MTQEFDLSRMELKGDPTTIAEDLQTNAGNGQAGFTASDTGLLAYRPGGAITNRQLLLTDRSGNRVGLPGTPAAFQNPVFSPDGQSIAVALQDQGADIWLMTSASGTMRRFTLDPGVDDNPVWSPGGREIVFSSTRDGGIANLYKAPHDSTGQEEVLLKSDRPKKPLSWSPDGRYVLFEDRHPDSGTDLWLLPTSGNQKPVEFVRTPFNESQAQFSPDGHWVAYVSDVSGRQEIYVQRSGSAGTMRPVSIGPGQQPRWRADSKEIFFLSQLGIEEFVSVAVEASSSESLFRTSEPRSLLNQYDILSQNQRNSFDITNDRFLLNVIPRSTGSPPAITVIVNWKP
jgi:Tol biopolymer transport system component